MVAAALKIKLNLKLVNTMEKEQLKPEFVKLNPQHTIPTLVDNGFSIWESKAICVYLIDKYAKDDSLFPKDPQTRAVINQRLYFDMGTLAKHLADYYFASFYGKTQDPESLKKGEEAVMYLNNFLEPTGFVAGTQQLSVADYAIFADLTTFEAVSFDFSPYPRVAKWLALMKETAPGREANEEGIEQLKAILKTV